MTTSSSVLNENLRLCAVHGAVRLCAVHGPVCSSGAVRVALCVVFCFVRASTVTALLQWLLALLSVRLNVCFMFHISVPVVRCSCHVAEAGGGVGIP